MFVGTKNKKLTKLKLGYSSYCKLTKEKMKKKTHKKMKQKKMVELKLNISFLPKIRVHAQIILEIKDKVFKNK